MSRNYELDSLKSREQDAFHAKQAAFQCYADARDRCNKAHDTMQAAWEARCSARENMNREYEEIQRASENYREVWDEYSRIRDYNNSRIESLKWEADREHQEMQNCFNQASSEYQYGDKSLAPVYSQEGHEHKKRRNELNSEISELAREVKEARQNAEWRAPKTDSSAFRRAKEVFEGAKSRHESAQTEFKRLKAERDRLKDAFDSLQAEHTRLKEEFQKKLEEVKAANKRARDKTLDEAGVRWSERDDAKIVTKPDGTTQVYHGGLGKGDCLGHGHTVLDQFGNKTYDRDAFAEHGHQNYADDPLKTYPGKGQWGELRHGWIDDHAVTWCEGFGVNAGQTLICDGHVDRTYFDSHHDHYGPNTKYRSGGRIEDITDSLGRKKYYSGPGK
jgi:hypothetical protein